MNFNEILPVTYFPATQNSSYTLKGYLSILTVY